MLNKSLAFGLLAAGLMIAPTAAFAGGQSQTNVQTTEQNSAATNGSTSVQNSNSVNVQQQIQKVRSGYGSHYSNYSTPHTSQSQNSYQSTSQSGAAVDGSVNAQNSNTVNTQHQSTRVHSSSYPYRY